MSFPFFLLFWLTDKKSISTGRTTRQAQWTAERTDPGAPPL